MWAREPPSPQKSRPIAPAPADAPAAALASACMGGGKVRRGGGRSVDVWVPWQAALQRAARDARLHRNRAPVKLGIAWPKPPTSNLPARSASHLGGGVCARGGARAGSGACACASTSTSRGHQEAVPPRGHGACKGTAARGRSGEFVVVTRRSADAEERQAAA